MKVINDLLSKMLRRKTIYWFAPTLFLFSLLLRIITLDNINAKIIEELLLSLIKNFLPISFLALGAGLVLSTAGVDLSSAGVITITGVIFASISQYCSSIIIIVLLPLSISILIGCLLSKLVYQKVNPLIASWSLGVILIATSLFIASFEKIKGTDQDVELGSIIHSVEWSFDSPIILFSFTTLFFLVFMLNMLNLPSKSKAVGANIDTARYLGINVKKIILLVYSFAALCSGIAGILFTITNNGATTVEHQGDELIGIAIAVLGGTMMSGGYFNQWSILSAAGFWVITNNILITVNLPGIAQEYQNRSASIVFSLFLLIMLFLFRKKLSQQTQSILTERKTDDD